MANRYTEEEDQIILKHIKERAGNIQEAIKKASLEIDRSPVSISERYYRTLRNREALFALISPTGVAVNTKIDKYGNRTKPSKLWNIIHRTLMSIFKRL